MDIAAPLLHEFTYQAMANDLLAIEDGNKYMLVLLNMCPMFNANTRFPSKGTSSRLR